MKSCVLKKDRIRDLCLEASGERETYVPVENMAGDVHFVKLTDDNRSESLDRMNLDYKELVIPPKTIGFPQLESLFEFQETTITETVPQPSGKLVFGIRACDLKGMLFVDAFFQRNFEDIYYLNRTEDRLLVLVGCKTPPRECFCTSTETGPFLKDGYDLQMTDIGDSYYVEIGSEKGGEFVAVYSGYFEDAPEDLSARAENAKKAAGDAVKRNVDFKKAVNMFCEDKIPQETYERIAERCILCGGCLYVCPTCTCFNVFDVQKSGKGTRYRNWDACVFEGYTREASGHNPRQQKAVRISRRYEHKLKYDYLTTGMSGCVGCGRCLASCPVDIGIIQVIEEAVKT